MFTEMFTLGVPKGSLEKNLERVMKQAKLPIKWKEKKGYTGSIAKKRRGLKDSVMCVKLRPQDIPVFVADGSLDAGLTGQDLIQEKGLEDQVVEILQLPISRKGNGTVRIVLFSLPGYAFQNIKEKKVVRVVTEYPRITKNYFKEKGYQVEIVEKFEENGGTIQIYVTAGCTESFVAACLADAGVDVTETGKTLREHGLEVIDTIMESSTVFIVNPAAWKHPEKRETIEKIKALLPSAFG